MKIILNENEVINALEQFVKRNYLKETSYFEVDVMEIRDTEGCSLGVENKINVELEISQQLSVAPVAPVASY